MKAIWEQLIKHHHLIKFYKIIKGAWENQYGGTVETDLNASIATLGFSYAISGKNCNLSESLKKLDNLYNYLIICVKIQWVYALSSVFSQILSLSNSFPQSKNRKLTWRKSGRKSWWGNRHKYHDDSLCSCLKICMEASGLKVLDFYNSNLFYFYTVSFPLLQSSLTQDLFCLIFWI